MKRKIRLTESDIHRIVKESVKRILKEGLYDTDDDNEIYDIGFSDRYRITWEFKTNGKHLYDYKTVSEGQKVVNSKDEAYKLFNMLQNKYEGTYATIFRVERLIKTLSDDRWEIEYDASNGYVRTK